MAASLALVASAVAAQCAFADGDPASDVLVSQDGFLPQTVPASLANDLAGLARQARTLGSPLKIALISAPTDLGSITSLYGRPIAYARFLSIELQTSRRLRYSSSCPKDSPLRARGNV